MGRGEACCTMLLHADDVHSSSGGTSEEEEDSAAVSGELVLMGAQVRQDGRSSSLTAPSGPAQQRLYLATLGRSGIQPFQLGYVEAHGTGTKLGDPVEVGSLRAALLDSSSSSRGSSSGGGGGGGGDEPPPTTPPPLAMGGLKANTGHTEGASGLPGLLKLVTLMASRTTAPNALLRVMNTHVLAAVQGGGGGGGGSRHGSGHETRRCCFPVNAGAGAGAFGASSITVPDGMVNAFGYSGTIAIALLRRREESRGGGVGARLSPFGHGGSFARATGGTGTGTTTTTTKLVYRRRSFLWRDDAASSSGSVLLGAGDGGRTSNTRMYNVCWVVAPAPGGPGQPTSTSQAGGLRLLRPPHTRTLVLLRARRHRHHHHHHHHASADGAVGAVVVLLPAASSAAPSSNSARFALALAQRLASYAKPLRLVLVTNGAFVVAAGGGGGGGNGGGAPPTSACAHGGAWGFARVLRLEHAAMRAQSIDDVPAAAAAAGAHHLSHPFAAAEAEAEAAYIGNVYRVARMRACNAIHTTITPPSTAAAAFTTRGCYALSGGLGGLGLRAATLLVEGGASRLLLTSRSARVLRDGQGLQAQLKSLTTTGAGAAAGRLRLDALLVVAADMADAAETRALLDAAGGHNQGSSSFSPIRGVLHAAGGSDRGLVKAHLDAQRMCWMYASKAMGARHLLSATPTALLQVCVCVEREPPPPSCGPPPSYEAPPNGLPPQ